MNKASNSLMVSTSLISRSYRAGTGQPHIHVCSPWAGLIPSDSGQLDGMSDIPGTLWNEAVLPCGGNTSQVDREYRHTRTCWCTHLCSYLYCKVLPWELRGTTGHICASITFYLTTCYFSTIFKWRSSNVFQICPAQREHGKKKMISMLN